MAASVTKKGRTTLTWGTNGMVPNTANVLTGGSLIVNRMTVKPNRFKGEVEDNDGASAMAAHLKDGEDVEIVVVHDADANIEYPSDGDVASLKSPLAASAANYIVDGDPEVDAAKKREVEVTIKAYKRGNYPS